MKVNSVQLRILVVGCLVATAGSFSSPAMAADYPPSIVSLEVGKPLTPPVAPKATGTIAVVPVATSDVIPIVIGVPVSAARVGLATKTLTNAALQSTPVKLSTSLVMGGIGADEKAPVATISNARKSEVQIPVDVPTRVTVTGFTPAATGQASFIDAKGNRFSLGNIKVSASGRVSIPALTFSKKGVSYTIRLVINGKTTSFTVRAGG